MTNPTALTPQEYPKAWTAATLQPADWQISIPEACLAELRAVLGTIRSGARPAESLRLDEFQLLECAGFIAAARAKADAGTGIACFDRLPIEECQTIEDAKALYWLMASLIAAPQPQYFERHMIYDLRFTGIHAVDNEQAHRVKTDEIEPHSDESLPDIGPRYVGLMCWRKARTGGATRLFSFQEAYRRMAAAEPELAHRLEQPFFWLPERKTPDDAIYYHPVLTRPEGRMRFQFSNDYNWRGYKKWGEPYDAVSSAALERFSAYIVETMFEYVLEPGQFVIFDNDTVGHGRSFHTDWDEPERKRHLLRLWLGTSGDAYPIPEALRARLLARQAA